MIEEVKRKTNRRKRRKHRNNSSNNKSNSRKYLLGMASTFVLFAYLVLPKQIFIFRPKPNSLSNTILNPYQEPIQKQITKEEQEEYIINDRSIQGHIIKIKPVATYEITARVVSKNYYNKNWDGELMPVDLAVSWGDLAKDKKHKYMTYYHSNRYYNWKYQGELHLSREYVISHSANIHFVASNKTIENALVTAKEDEIIYVQGYLIDIYGPNGDTRRSSTNRSDIGNGACENIYVEKLIIGNEVFE